MSKVWITALILIAAAGAGAAFYLHSANAKPVAALSTDTTTAPVARGDIIQSVTASGPVASNLDVLIKCRASGLITQLPVDISSSVKKGDLLMQLDTKDEDVLVDQATQNELQSESRVKEAESNYQMAQLDLVTATAQAEADIKAAEIKAINLRKKADRQKQLLGQNMASQEEYETAETDASQAETDLQTAKISRDKLKSEAVSVDVKKEDIELANEQVALDQITLKNAQTQKGYCTVTSDLDGVVSDLTVQKGTIIASAISNTAGGTTVMTISDMSHIFVLASVDESDIGNVLVGQPADITADAFPGKHFEGKVVRIAIKGVNVSNVVTFEVKIEVTSKNKDLLKPLMTADAKIIESSEANVLNVPLLAVIHKQRKTFVNIVKADGTSEEHEVMVGISDGENQEIVSGLNGDEKILVHKNESASNWAAPGRARMPGMGMPGGGGKRE